jgi:hypothetical protein
MPAAQKLSTTHHKLAPDLLILNKLITSELCKFYDINFFQRKIAELIFSTQTNARFLEVFILMVLCFLFIDQSNKHGKNSLWECYDYINLTSNNC